jgi:hypothetical protein
MAALAGLFAKQFKTTTTKASIGTLARLMAKRAM